MITKDQIICILGADFAFIVTTTPPEFSVRLFLFSLLVSAFVVMPNRLKDSAKNIINPKKLG